MPGATRSRPVGADGTTNALSFDVEHLGLAQGAARDYYYNESWQVVEERKDGSDDAHTEYVWDARYIDAPVLVWQDANGDGDTSDTNETLYYTNDANFNVTAVVDTSGNVVERYMYDPYGNVTVLDGTTGGQTDWAVDADGASDVGNEILYAGYRYDTETGLYHVRHRMYHPTLGRWMTRDPIGYADGMNLYEYVSSRPTAYIDPLGKHSASASVGTDYAYGGECCCTGEKDCYLAVKWALPGEVGRDPATGTPKLFPARRGMHVTTSVIDSKGWLSYTYQAFASVEIVHKEDKPVGGCHLRQEVTRRHVGRAEETIKEDYSSRMPPIPGQPGSGIDADPHTKGFQNEAGRTIYKGYKMHDAPATSGSSKVGQTKGQFWQAHVWVEEATSVDKYYGYYITLEFGSGGPRVSGRTWVSDEPAKAFDPSRNLGVPGARKWHGPSPVNVRTNQPAPKSRYGYMEW